MRLAPLLLPLLAAACALPPERLAGDDRGNRQIAARAFTASLAFDPPSFELHGACGRGMTGPSRRPPQVTMTANSGTWIRIPWGGAAQFETRNLLGGMSSLSPFPGGPRYPAIYTLNPTSSGNYEFAATIAATGSHPEVTAGPETYVIPLEVTLKVQADSAPGFLRASASANTTNANNGAPTTFSYSFCVRSANGSADDQWSDALMQVPVWSFQPPQPGPWLVYVAVFATQQGYPVPPNDFAAIGEQMAHFP
jgi:hypothetical protein